MTQLANPLSRRDLRAAPTDPKTVSAHAGSSSQVTPTLELNMDRVGFTA